MPGFKPPNGSASQFEPDTERMGGDGRMWRSVKLYEGSAKTPEQRRKALVKKKGRQAWMPLDATGNLLKPNSGSVLIMTGRL